MPNGRGSYVGGGARRGLRDWPAFLWLYLANLVLALLAAAGVTPQVGAVLNSSLEGERLARGFDLAVFGELLLRPEVSLRGLVPASVFAALVFALVTLFLTAGIVQSFLSEQHLRMGPFFQGCGEWFWRFFWLTLVNLVILGIVLGVLAIPRYFLVNWADKSPNERLSFYVGLGSLLVMWLAAGFLRLWFDLTQFSLVHAGKFWRAIPAGLRLLRQGFFRLFWIYFSITLVGWAGLAAGLWLWVKLPPAAVGHAFLLGQAILILWLATRYWQRAAEALWFRAHAPALPAPGPTDSAPAPLPLPMPQTPAPPQ